MSYPSRRSFQLAIALASLLSMAAGVEARDRVRGVIDGRAMVERPGNRHPSARADLATGEVSADTRMERMLLVLSGDAEQEQALEKLLDEQQDTGSPNYQKWITPEGFGDRFGVSSADLQRISDWLEIHGFEVEPATDGRRTLVFSGTAAQVERAFSTRMRTYDVNGRRHISNASSPSIPLALAGVVEGVVSLHDFRKGGMARATPAYTSGGSHYLLPGDLAAIYDVKALYASGLDGTGTSIAVISRSNILVSDVAQFRGMAGLAPNPPRVILNGRDPGLQSGDQMEATADVQWAGGVAPNASIFLVISATTTTTDGIDLSATYAVNNNLAPVITLSYGLCEAMMGAAENKFYNSLWQQAAAQGITVLVSSGDSGSAGCDGAGSSTAHYGSAVNGLCSSPYSTCVGGTMFSGDTANPGKYWSAGNTPGNVSALSYIPEVAWNESGGVGGGGLWASGGGASNVYAKPGWQSAPGVPADGRRDVPDVSLSASAHDGYLVPMSGANWCVSGTSLSTPSLAGLMALSVQKQNARLGNANPVLYALASNQAKGGAAVFHDVAGGNNGVPGQSGFDAAPGYDLATGLGSVDAFELVNHWSEGAGARPSFGLALSKPSALVAMGLQVGLRVSFTAANGFSAPVTLAAQGIPKGVTATFTPATLSGSATSSTLTLSAGASATAGVANVIINGTSGTLSNSAALSVRVCTYALEGPSALLASGQQSVVSKVTASAGCGWTGTTDSAWVIFASGASGEGPGVLNYTLASNTTPVQRQAVVSAGGVSITVKQSGAAAVAFKLSAVSANVASLGGTGSVTVSASPSTLAWTASSAVSWISVKSSSTQVTYTVAANTGAGSRSGVLTIAGQTFTVVQAGLTCISTVTAGRVIATGSSLGVTLAVTESVTACTWSAVSNASWITIVSAGGGRGNDVVTLSMGANGGAASRVGTLTVAGKVVTVTEGLSVTVTVGP